MSDKIPGDLQSSTTIPDLKTEVISKQDGNPSPVNHPNFIPEPGSTTVEQKPKQKAFMSESKPPSGQNETNGNKSKPQVKTFYTDLHSFVQSKT